MVPWRATRGRIRHAQCARLVRALRARPSAAPSWSRPRASATWPAVRCCASARTDSSPGSSRLVETRAARERRRDPPVHSAHRFPVASAGGPKPQKYFERFLAITAAAPARARHARWRRCRGARAARGARAERARGCARPRANSRRCAWALASASPTPILRTLRPCPQALPELFARAARARPRGRLRRRRAALRARLHHGLVSVGDQHPRRRLRRRRASSACGCRSRCWPRCAPRPAATSSVGARILAEECIEAGRAVSRRGILCRRAGGARDGLHFAVARRQIRRRAAAEGRAQPPIRTPGRAATNACRATIRTRPARMDAISRPRRGSAPRCARRATDTHRGRRRHSQFPAGRVSARGRAPATSSASRARRSPIRIGF